MTVQENTDYSTGVGVDFSIFITLLANPQSSDEGNLINLLQQGLDSWRLPMIAHMHRSANADKDVERISAITWIEKNRVFLRAAINQNPSLLEWLEHPQQADMQSIMQHFTTQLYTLLDEKSLLDIHGENAIIDVRKVLIISSNISSNYSDYICRSVRYCSFGTLKRKKLMMAYSEFLPDPLSCFIDAITGISGEERVHRNLKVSGDVLLWLLLTHCENAEISKLIMDNSILLDQVSDAFNNRNKVQNIRVKLMTNPLSDIQNFPRMNSEKFFVGISKAEDNEVATDENVAGDQDGVASLVVDYFRGSQYK